MWRKLTIGKLALVGAAMIATGAQIGAAESITIKTSSVNAATGVFVYTITLDSTTQIASGDGFVIYDFGALAGPATLTPQTGGGGLTISDFTVNTTGNSANTNQGNALSGPIGVNQVAQTDANVHSGQLPSPYADASGTTPAPPGDGLSNPTFDNPAVPNLNFVYNQSTAFTPGTTQTYLLTLTTSAINSMNMVSISEAVGEDQDTSNSPSVSLTEQLVDIPLGNNGTTIVFGPAPKASLGGLALFGLVGIGGLLKKRFARA